MLKTILLIFFLFLFGIPKQVDISTTKVGFIVWDEMGNCHFLPAKDTLINSCLVGFQTRNLKSGRQLSINWTKFLKDLRQDIDTLDRKNIPDGFADYMYRVHVVAVKIKYIEKKNKQSRERGNNYYMVFDDRTISFTSFLRDIEILDIKSIPCLDK